MQKWKELSFSDFVVKVFEAVVATTIVLVPPIMLTIVVEDFVSLEDLSCHVSLLPYFSAQLRLLLLIAGILFVQVFLDVLARWLLSELIFS